MCKKNTRKYEFFVERRENVEIIGIGCASRCIFIRMYTLCILGIQWAVFHCTKFWNKFFPINEVSLSTVRDNVDVLVNAYYFVYKIEAVEFTYR